MKELKIGKKIKYAGYDRAWIGWVTNSSYLITKIKNILDENGNTSEDWLWKNIEVEWVLKSDYHSQPKTV